jgi:hypothetical protein
MPLEPPVLPAPALPVLPVLGAPLPIALPVVPVLGEALDPPAAVPVSRWQRSLSRPVSVSQRVLLPVDGKGVDGVVGELALGSDEEPDAPAEPLAEEPVLPEPPTLCDDDCAIAATENASSAAAVAVESTFSIVLLLCEGGKDYCVARDASAVPRGRVTVTIR